MSDRPTTVHLLTEDGSLPSSEVCARVAAAAGHPVEIVPTGSPLAVSADREAVVLVAPVVLPEGWLAELRASVPQRLSTGSVSALALDEREPGELARVGAGLRAFGPAAALDRAQLPCVLFPQAALELAGGAKGDDAAAVVAELSDRLRALGLSHVLSARVVVGGTPSVAGEGSPAGHLAGWARRVSRGLRLTVDGRSLNTAGAGTQVHTLELVAGLSERRPPGTRIRVVLPPDPSELARSVLSRLDGVEPVGYAEIVDAGLEPDDVVHRPFQIYTIHDMRLLQRLGRRVVVTHQDQLLYRNPDYFTTAEDWTWEAYRDTCRMALAWADRVVFFTEHARDETLRDELVEPARADVVPIGVERSPAAADTAPAAPPGLAPAEGRPFLLLLGSDLAHKNRTFALRLLAELRRAHGWEGALVLAGPTSGRGTRRDDEARLIAEGDLPVIVLERVSEAERIWLLAHCRAVLSPSVEEGFGLMPFEAAGAGVPCLFASVGSLAEVLPPAAATLRPWDPRASADAALPLLTDEGARAAHVAAIRGAAEPLTWSASADRLYEVYDRALRAPRRPTALLAAAEVELGNVPRPVAAPSRRSRARSALLRLVGRG